VRPSSASSRVGGLRRWKYLADDGDDDDDDDGDDDDDDDGDDEDGGDDADADGDDDDGVQEVKEVLERGADYYVLAHYSLGES
jgi:hypothetical protein